MKGQVQPVGNKVIESITSKHCSKRKRRSSRIKGNKKKKKIKKKHKTNSTRAKAYIDNECDEASSDGSSNVEFEDFMPSRNRDDYSIGSRDSNKNNTIHHAEEDYNDDDDSFIVDSDVSEQDGDFSSDNSHVDFEDRKDINKYTYHDGANKRLDLKALMNDVGRKKKTVIDDSSSSFSEEEEEEEEEEIEEEDKKLPAVDPEEEEKNRLLNERARASKKIPNPLHLIQCQMSKAPSTQYAPPQQSAVPYSISCYAGEGFGEEGVKDVNINQVLQPYATYLQGKREKSWEMLLRDTYAHMKNTGESYVRSTSDDPRLGEWAKEQRNNTSLPDWKRAILNQIGFAWQQNFAW